VGKKTGPNPTDRAKTGTKRSLLTDGQGVPLGIAVAGANVPDYQLTEATLESIPVSRPEPRVPATPEAPTAGQEQGMCLDQGYFYEAIYELLDRWGYTAHIRPLGSESGVREMNPQERREAGVQARRWVVERTHSWLNRFRGLLIRWCKKPENYLAMLHFACALITWRVTDLLG
jgi:putative transposase